MEPSALQSSPRSITITDPAQLLSTNGIKTTIPSSASAFSYSGAALNGSLVGADQIARPAPNSHINVAQYPIAVAAANTGSYVIGSKIVFTGTYCGYPVTRTATVTSANGGTIIADGPVHTVSKIDGEAQHDTSGAWTFGFTDLACRQSLRGTTAVPLPFRSVRGGAIGVVSCVYSGGATDLLPVTSGEKHLVEPVRIVQATTTAAFTVYE